MKIRIKDHKNGYYELYTNNEKTFIQSFGRYNFCGEVIEQEEKICFGGKLSIKYKKEGSLYPNVFVSGTITDISVLC